MDYRLALMTGVDLPVPECQLAVHQPTILEWSHIGEEILFIGLQYLCINKNMLLQDESVLSNKSNFQIFMTVMASKEGISKKEAVGEVLKLLLPNNKCILTPRSIMIAGDASRGSTLIDEDNFDAFQNVVAQLACLTSTLAGSQGQFNPQSPKAKEIADKLMRARQRVAAQKKDGDGSVFGRYVSILTTGLGLPLQSVLNLTIYQIYDLMQRYNLLIEWDLNIKTRLAGGTPNSEPENWMKDIH